MDLTIITYQGSQLLTELFNAIAATFGTSSYQTLLRIAALTGFVIVLTTSVFKQKFMENIHWFICVFLFYNLLLVPKLTVHIEDRVTHQHAVVDNVPLGLAIFASITSQIGDAFTQLMEQTFSLPNDLRYSQSGTVMASRLVENATQWKPINPQWTSELKAFVQGCVWYDILLNKYTLEELMTTPNLWGLISQQASPARLYPSKDGLITCQEGSQQLTQGWPKVIDEAGSYYGGRIFTQDETRAKAAFLSFLPTSVQYLTGFSQSSNESLQQILMANVFYDTLSSPSHRSPMNAGMQSLALAHMKLLQYANGWTLGEWGAESLVLLKNALEALMYGGFLIIAWFLLLPNGVAILKNYLTCLLWLQSFAPLYAVLNLLLTFHAQALSSSAFQGTAFSPLSLQGFPLFASTNADMVTVASWLSFSIPAIAFGLVRGGVGAMSQGIGQLSYLVQSLTMRTAEEATSGNLNFGNTQLDTHTAHSNSAYQTNRNIHLQSGQMTYQQPDGALIHRTQEGLSVIDSRNAISNTAVNTTWGQAIRHAAQQQAELATTTGLQHSQAYTEATTSALRELYEVGHSQGYSNSRDSQHNISQSAQWGENATQMHQLVERFAKDNNLSTGQSVQILGEVSASLGLSASLGKKDFKILPVSLEGQGQFRGGAQIQGLSSAQRAEVYQHAKNFVQSTQLNENLDNTLRAAHDQHQRQGVEDSHRLTKQLNDHYETANTARNEAVAQFHQAESLRDLSSLSHEEALSLSANLGQPFVNWLSEQPKSDGSLLGITGAEKLLNQHPEKIAFYLEKFILQELPEIQSSLMKPLPNQETLVQKYHDIGQTIQQDQQVMKNKNQYDSQIKAEAQAVHKNVPEFPDIQGKAEDYLQQQTDNFNQLKTQQISQGEIQKKNVVQETDLNKHNLTRKVFSNAKQSVESIWKNKNE